MQLHEYLDPSNRPEDCRSVGAIALGPNENELSREQKRQALESLIFIKKNMWKSKR